MNNLKRVLSLGLTGTMLAGMMVMGAGAANFSDADKITNTDAVNTMVALGVIKGKDTGAFDPTGNVTRAEMAKMLCVAINGGKEPVLGVKTTPTYKDIKGHWAESYIEYCSSMGYVAGRGDGSYGPDATVTSTEAAKMILTTMGYKAEVSGFVGLDWAINTNSQANQVGLYKKLSGINTSVAMSRDNAAQMLYNALDAKTVELGSSGADYKTSTYTYTGTESVAVGSEKVYVFTSKVSELNVLNNEEYSSYADAAAAATAVKSDAKLGTDYTLASLSKVVYGTQSVTKTKDETFGHKYLSLDTYDEDMVYLKKVEKDAKGTYTVTLSDGVTYTKVAEDFSALMGEKVKVLSKASDDVYGVFASGGAVLATGVIGDIDCKAGDTTVDFGDNSYKLDNTTAAKTPVYAFNNFDGATTTNLGTLPTNKAASFKAVDLDGDGKVDQVVYTPFTVAKVTYVGSKSFTAGGKTVKFEDANVYEGMAKNDYVTIVAAKNTVDDTETYAKVDTIVSGAITSTKNSGKSFKIADTWYDIADTTLLISGGSETATAGGTASKAVIVNGYAFYLDTSKTVETKDYAVVISAVGSFANGLNGNQAKLIFTDGTKKVVDTDKNYSATVSGGGSNSDSLVAKLVTYKVEDDKYVLTPAKTASGDASAAGFDEVIQPSQASGESSASIHYNYAKNSKSTIEGNYIAPDAVVFVKKSETSYSVVTGATLMKMATATVKNAYADKNSSNGYSTISLAYVEGNVTSADTQYGYVVSSIETVDNSDNGLVATFKIFNGTETVTVTTSDKANSADLTNLAKNTVITYVADGNYIDVKSVAKLDKATSGIGAIVAYNGSDEIQFLSGMTTETIGTASVDVVNKNGSKSNLLEIDKDTVILTVNVADKEGVTGGELAIADKTPNGNYYANAYYVMGTGNTVALIVYCNDILNVNG